MIDSTTPFEAALAVTQAEWVRSLIDDHRLTRDLFRLQVALSASTVGKLLRNERVSITTLERVAVAFSTEIPPEVQENAGKRIVHDRMATVGRAARVEYQAFCNMHNRCSNPKCEHFPAYGASGIRVCERWCNTRKGFENFYSDLGPRPTRNHSLHRTPANASYSPETCKWATKKEQAVEQRGRITIELNDEKLTPGQFAERTQQLGIVYFVDLSKPGRIGPARRITP